VSNRSDRAFDKGHSKPQGVHSVASVTAVDDPEVVNDYPEAGGKPFLKVVFGDGSEVYMTFHLAQTINDMARAAQTFLKR
jgi:hypothetical protein